MKAIVFESKTGNTKKYAEILGQKTGLPVYDHKGSSRHLNKQDEIIYMGWLFASGIKGYEKAAKNYDVKAVCGVGMRRPSDEAVKDMVGRNHISGPKVFYFQGGYDVNKLSGIYKFMMKMMSKVILKEIEKKETKTDEELESIDMINNGRCLVKEENLVPIIEWLK
jgi:menaquinone-dependent protoporphyrinogen IX oxidase